MFRYLAHLRINQYSPPWCLGATWWRHQMETFSALLAICAGNSPVSGGFTAQRLFTRSFDVFFDLCLNKRLRKQWWGWLFETLSLPLWRHCNAPGSISTNDDYCPRRHMVSLSELDKSILGMWCNQLWDKKKYRKISNMRLTKSPNLNDSRLVLKLSLPNLLKPGVK